MHTLSTLPVLTSLFLALKKLMLPLLILSVLLGMQLSSAQTSADMTESEAYKMEANSASLSLLEIVFIEQGDTLILYPDNTCSINSEDKVTLNEDSALWTTVTNKAYLERLSGLVILEQVKQLVQQSRVVMTINPDAETTLILRSDRQTKDTSLYSVDLMHATYPQASMLTQFMEVVILMRDAKKACLDASVG